MKRRRSVYASIKVRLPEVRGSISRQWKPVMLGVNCTTVGPEEDVVENDEDEEDDDDDDADHCV